jgi:hypothetical protein
VDRTLLPAGVDVDSSRSGTKPHPKTTTNAADKSVRPTQPVRLGDVPLSLQIVLRCAFSKLQAERTGGHDSILQRYGKSLRAAFTEPEVLIPASWTFRRDEAHLDPK